MYDYSQLEAMLLPGLYDVAKDMKVPYFRKLKRKELIDKILEFQSGGSAKSSAKPAESTTPKANPEAETSQPQLSFTQNT
ncbi:MAG: hypothetical protein EOP53_18245, partial [Sphingobacteriales bacterium]